MRTWRASVAVFPNLLTAVVKMEHSASDSICIQLKCPFHPRIDEKGIDQLKGKTFGQHTSCSVWDRSWVRLHHYSHSSRVNTQLSLHRTVPQGQNQNCQQASSFFQFYMNASWCCVDVVRWLNVVVRKQVCKCLKMTIIICRLLFYILQQNDIQSFLLIDL